MATPPNKITANTNSSAALATIESAADQIFIDDATAAINQAIALGKFQASLTTGRDVNIQIVHDYFVSLGYRICYPDLNALRGNYPVQSAGLFGAALDLFWQNGIHPLKSPTRLILSWA